MIGYLCAYLRFYYPHAFIVAYLNHAKTDEDIKAGTDLAKLYNIQVVPPRFGKSKDKYVYNAESKTIGKGVASVKYMNDDVANSLYQLSQEHQYNTFVDLLADIDEQTSLDSRQLDILIKLDYFADFGNQTELQKLVTLMGIFKYGNAKSIRKEKVNGKYYEPLVQQYAVGTNKDGSESASYTFVGWNTEPINNAIKGVQDLLRKAKRANDTELITLYEGILNENKAKLNQAIKESVMKMLRTCETQIKALSLPDVPLKTKIQNQMDLLGYIEIATGKEEDLHKLYIMKVRPLVSQKTGQIWAYSLDTKSIGRGRTSNFTIMAGEYQIDPIRKGDIICVTQHHWKINKKTGMRYWYIDAYYKII